MTMKIIGMTGGIGCGKSEVCRYLAEQYGAAVIYSDLVAHELMEPGTACYRELVELFGEEYLLPDGHLNRKKIGDIAFRDPEMISRMNAIVHPAVWDEIVSRIRTAEQEGKDLVILESALLVGSAYRQLCDEFWNVYADEQTRIRRLVQSRDITEEKAKSVMDRQHSAEQFRDGCDFTLDNSGAFSETQKAIDARFAEGTTP